MIYNDRMIFESLQKRDIVIEPYTAGNLQPNSYDVSLGDTIIKDGMRIRLPYTFEHGDFILGTTLERIEINRNCCCMVDGKSTTARHGVCVHLTAGFIDCGFRGNVTLEMVNFGRAIELVPGMKIGQLVFYQSPTSDRPYNGHYQDQNGVTPAWDEQGGKA